MTSDKVFTTRRSIVCFDEKPIPTDILSTLFEAARWAPSANNQQPWRFIIGVKATPSYNAIFEALNPSNKIWSYRAPILIASVAEIYNVKRESINKYAWHDCGLALSNLILQATLLGLFVHPMAGFNSASIQKVFDIPEAFEPVCVAAIGYSGSCNDLPVEVTTRNSAERKRLPIDELVFNQTWKKPYKF